MGMVGFSLGIHAGGGPERHVLARRSAGRPSAAGEAADGTREVRSVDVDDDARRRSFVAPWGLRRFGQ